MRKAIAPSLEVAGNILTGTSTSERRRLPDQTGMGAMRDTRGRYGLPRIWSNRRPPQVNKDGPRKGTSPIRFLTARPTSKWNGLLWEETPHGEANSTRCP